MPLHRLVAEWDPELAGGDPLHFPGYPELMARVHGESVSTGVAEIDGAKTGARYAFIEGRFDVLGGSMGAAHGEKVVRAYRRAVDERLPVVVLTASGGARMQEGMVSLVQMARTATAAADHAAAGLLSCAVYLPPTTGGVFASYGSLVDVRAAQPGATVGFAGPRVVEQTLGIRLPEDTHTAESAHAAGLVDALVAPDQQAAWVSGALGAAAVPPPAPVRVPPGPDAPARTPWEEVLAARATTRPTGTDWAAVLCESWTELAGVDPVVRAGLATIGGTRAVVIAMDRYAGDGGRPTPAGFRLAQRAIALAGRLSLPVLTFVDTPGAHPGPDSERDGVAGEIARTFAAMACLPPHSVAVCVGEGGSGGALALAHADRLLMLEHAVFSVIAPEGAAAILLRDASRAPELADRLHLTAADQVELGVADTVVGEDVEAVRTAVASALDQAVPGDRLRRLDALSARWIRP